MNLFPNGIGETLGSTLLTTSPLFFSGTVWHVDSTNTDAVDSSAYGVSKNRPFATLAYAITQATAQDMIVLHDGHTETFTAVQDLTSKALIIAGAGQSDGKPTVKLTMNASAASMFSTADDTVLANIWFEEQSQANSAALVDHTAGLLVVVDCYFEADENSNNYCLDANASADIIIESTTFVSNATDVTDLPTGAFISGAATRVQAKNVTLNANSKGWGTAAMFLGAGVTRWENLTLTGNNSVTVTESSGNHLFLLTSNSEAPQLVEA